MSGTQVLGLVALIVVAVVVIALIWLGWKALDPYDDEDVDW